MSIRVLTVLLTLAWSLAAPAHTLIYSGNLDGELEPCGCTAEGDLGGLLRRATVIGRLRREAPGLFLVSSGGLFNPAGATDRITSAYILEGLARLGYDAVGLQWKDLAYGPGFVAGALPWVASNWRGTEFAQGRRIRRGGLELAYFQWVEPEGGSLAGMGRVPLDTDPAGLSAAMAEARAQGALVVLGTTLTAEEALRRLPARRADILIVRSAYERYGEPREVEGVLVLQPGSRGQRLGRLDFEWDPQRRITAWRHEVIAMPPSVPDDPALADWYAAYTEALRADFRRRKALRARYAGEASPYAGAEACRGCHASAHARWADSDHARAYLDLEAVQKAFDANCVGCHTVGFGEDGGFVDMELTPDLAGVQCESCHGAARAHVASGGRTPPAGVGAGGAALCRRCHSRGHSPSFDFTRYWPRIAHGREAERAQASAASSRSAAAASTAAPAAKR
ncbi:multiheme c-type cytochrome [Inmirania thermothiophila]|uniref:Cytochrome c554/c'-like protein n=1 Tax=Inmirania thermothiophila TaxID=1750597 RepID=A0A3N1Y1B5_9GAMM|nr:multiheme c-type cytochrome [Inmirania thermothiophila]ROR32623.1 cytochrome c554/c'-like protein [Inmirania thermothiophila]